MSSLGSTLSGWFNIIITETTCDNKQNRNAKLSKVDYYVHRFNDNECKMSFKASKTIFYLYEVEMAAIVTSVTVVSLIAFHAREQEKTWALNVKMSEIYDSTQPKRAPHKANKNYNHDNWIVSVAHVPSD